MKTTKGSSRRASGADPIAPLFRLCRELNVEPDRLVELLRDGRIRQLEDENQRLRALVADLSVEAWTRHSTF